MLEINYTQIIKHKLQDLIELKNLKFTNLISYPAGFDLRIELSKKEDITVEEEPKEINTTDLREYFIK